MGNQAEMDENYNLKHCFVCFSLSVMHFYHSCFYYCKLHRPSDGYGTAQFGQTRAITHNLRKFAKSCTIQKCLLEILITVRTLEP